MKRGIEIFWTYDYRDQTVLRITKKRGKLTLEEISDLIRYENNQMFCGHYAILLNCSEVTINGDDLYLYEGQKGDVVDLYKIEEGEFCPVCGNYTPPFEYCPNCGTAWKDISLDIEKLIAIMREEATQAIQSDTPDTTQNSRMAQYWSYIGALNMAQRLGMITDKRYQKLYHEADTLREQSVNSPTPKGRACGDNSASPD